MNYLQVKDLKPGTGKVNLEITVKSLGEIKSFDKYGRTVRVCTAIVSDGSDDIDLSLWNEHIDMVKAGVKLKIENGYVNEYQGIRQLTVGKYGKLTVL